LKEEEKEEGSRSSSACCLAFFPHFTEEKREGEKEGRFGNRLFEAVPTIFLFTHYRRPTLEGGGERGGGGEKKEGGRIGQPAGSV